MTSQNYDIIKTNAKVTWHDVKRNMIYKKLDCIRSNSEKLDSENKQKKLCSGIQTYFSWNKNYFSIIFWYFNDTPPMEAIFEILIMSVMKTADINFF